MVDIPIARVRIKECREYLVGPGVRVTGSTLLIEPLDPCSDPRKHCHGMITVPMALTVGQKFVLTLCEPVEPATATRRKFREE